MKFLVGLIAVPVTLFMFVMNLGLLLALLPVSLVIGLIIMHKENNP